MNLAASLADTGMKSEARKILQELVASPAATVNNSLLAQQMLNRWKE